LKDTTIRFVIRDSGPEYLMHYVVTRGDSLGASCVSDVQIFSASNENKMQEWRDTLSFDDPFCLFPEEPTFVDFNFDGYKDICFECFWSGFQKPFQLMFFRQYNPKTKIFEPALQFDELEGSITVGNDKTIHDLIPMGSGGQAYIESIYKYSHDKLVLIERTERRWEYDGFKLIIQKPVKGVLKTVSVLHEQH
jgi:hypothetical protein